MTNPTEPLEIPMQGYHRVMLIPLTKEQAGNTEYRKERRIIGNGTGYFELRENGLPGMMPQDEALRIFDGIQHLIDKLPESTITISQSPR